MSINKWDSKDIEDEIIHYLNTGKQVFLTSGATNDCIISYSEKNIKEMRGNFIQNVKLLL